MLIVTIIVVVVVIFLLNPKVNSCFPEFNDSIRSKILLILVKQFYYIVLLCLTDLKKHLENQ